MFSCSDSMSLTKKGSDLAVKFSFAVAGATDCIMI
jgi:hypothetical protein